MGRLGPAVAGLPRAPVDPYRQADALREAQLLAIEVDALRSRAALLFELRLAVDEEDGNTGLLVASGVRRCSWSAGPRSTSRTAWNVAGWSCVARGGCLEIEVSFLPEATLHLAFEDSMFSIGTVQGLGDVPPDYTGPDEAAILTGLASWDSPITLTSSVGAHDRSAEGGR